jgi:2-dehydropantoate 2-reductase
MAVAAPRNETWHVLGAGSLGQVWAALLHRARRPACLLLRDSARREAYRAAGGITLHDEHGVELITPLAAIASRAVHASRLLVATKAHQTMEALERVLTPDSTAIVAILQNGMGIADEIEPAYPLARIFLLVTTAGAWRDAPFTVHRAGTGHTVVGAHDAKDDDESQPIARSLDAPGLPHSVSDDIRAAQWRKLAVNCVINPLTALHGLRNGEVPADPRTRDLIAPLCEEIARVATAEGIATNATELRATVDEVCRVTADNRNSMSQDLRAGRATEIDYLNGYVLRRARAHSIACRVNQSIYDEIRLREAASAS